MGAAVAFRGQMREWAAAGVRLEIQDIESQMGTLRDRLERAKRALKHVGGKGAMLKAGLSSQRRKAWRKPMTAAQKKAVSVRMKAYWASRRAASRRAD